MHICLFGVKHKTKSGSKIVKMTNKRLVLFKKRIKESFGPLVKLSTLTEHDVVD